jgi:uncharacterized protein YndB with AHSA1/START domain
MASVAVTPDQDALVSEIHIAAPPERVFQALIDPKQGMQWWSNPEFPIESYAIDPRPGGRWRYDTKQCQTSVNGVSKFHCEGEVLECDPPRMLAYTWIANWHERPTQRTVVRWELAASKGGTLLRVTHSGLGDLPASRKDYSSGWPELLDTLRKFIESDQKQ